MDPTRNYHLVTSMNNTMIPDKVAKQVWEAPRTLQDAFKRALSLEAGIYLAESIHLVRLLQVIQVSTDGPWQCSQKAIMGVYITYM